MKESLQIEIPTPCREDWERMVKGDIGRHCNLCQKTVVDFTGMTDAEVCGYFNARGRDAEVCGRFLPGQIGRPLAPAPVQRNGWSGWRWVLASALMMVRPPEGGKPVKTDSVERRDSTIRSTIIETDGMVIHVEKGRKKMARIVADSVRVWLPSIVRMDSVEGPEVTGGMPMVNEGVKQQPLVGYLGAVTAGTVICRRGPDSSILQKVADTVSVLNIFRKEDFVTLYPNPVERGGALHMAWLSEGGSYQLTLLDMRGRLVAERLVEVGGAGQVDQWVIPVGLAAGVYVLRITERSEVLREGGRRVDVREVMVR
jgi:hypothetical protein